MAASVILVQFFYSDGSTLPVKVWVMDGTMPYPEWPDANMVFVLNPPPLDILLLADVWKAGRTLVLRIPLPSNVYGCCVSRLRPLRRSTSWREHPRILL
jgi:hypothetical protein